MTVQLHSYDDTKLIGTSRLAGELGIGERFMVSGVLALNLILLDLIWNFWFGT
jgi:hypothetical protein